MTRCVSCEPRGVYTVQSQIQFQSQFQSHSQMRLFSAPPTRQSGASNKLGIGDRDQALRMYITGRLALPTCIAGGKLSSLHVGWHARSDAQSRRSLPARRATRLTSFGIPYGNEPDSTRRPPLSHRPYLTDHDMTRHGSRSQAAPAAMHSHAIS